jgi:hypothetical protein
VYAPAEAMKERRELARIKARPLSFWENESTDYIEDVVSSVCSFSFLRKK